MASTGVQAFTAADTTALAALGWTEDTGHIHVVTNKAESQTINDWNRARYTTTPMDSANHYVQATVGVRDYSNYGDISARQATSAHTFYELAYIEDNFFRLNKLVTGSETVLDEYTTGTGALVLKLIVNGAVQEGYISGTLRLDATDAAITTGTYAGIACWSNNGGRWDDWSAADLAAGGVSIPLDDRGINRGMMRGMNRGMSRLN